MVSEKNQIFFFFTRFFNIYFMLNFSNGFFCTVDSRLHGNDGRRGGNDGAVELCPLVPSVQPVIDKCFREKTQVYTVLSLNPLFLFLPNSFSSFPLLWRGCPMGGRGLGEVPKGIGAGN